MAPNEVVATVVLKPDFSSTVEINPENAPNNELILLLLFYGAKLRWLVNTEPEEVKGALVEWANKVALEWDQQDIDAISDLKQRFIKDGIGTEYKATNGEEKFEVHYLYSEGKTGRVVNYLPEPQGVVINLAWHYVVLLEKVHEILAARIDSDPNILSISQEMQLQFWQTVMQNEQIFNGESTEVLIEISKLAMTTFLEVHSNNI